ncbi:MAG: hypothetical protein GEU93_05925 [Propionibacteriales bacterium]|nr:hypothetical protein [Propionibacteriales bacterium]
MIVGVPAVPPPPLEGQGGRHMRPGEPSTPSGLHLLIPATPVHARAPAEERAVNRQRAFEETRRPHDCSGFRITEQGRKGDFAMSTMITRRVRFRGDATRLWIAVALVFALAFALLAASVRPAVAEQAAPTGVSVEQGQGFATVSWDVVEGATEYQIERTPLDGDEPAGPGEVVGVWFPNRHLGPPPEGNPTGDLTFADSGFVLGDRYQWRVRAVMDDTEGEWSEPVAGGTQEPVGPEEFRTGFELSDGQEWTTHEDEVEVVEAIAAASDRVRLDTIGETYEGRPMQLATVGFPEAPDADQIADSPSVFIMCTIHGAERSGREACMILLRELAFSDDERVTDILSQATVLINPTANPDGQSIARRTNTAGQDLNRDSLLLRHPETFPLAEAIRDYEPELIVDAHEKGGGPDTDPSWPRSQIINEELVSLAQNDLVIGRLFGDGNQAGWSMRPYTGWANNNWEAWHHNMAGMKNALGTLLETARATPASRPAEGNVGGFDQPGSQPRRVYTHLWSLHTLLDYHHENLSTIEDVLAVSEAANTANQGPVYVDGAYAPPYDPPFSRVEPFTVELDPFCGYRLSGEQYQVRDSGTLIGPLAGQEWTSATVEDRLAAHGVEVEDVGAGIVQVPLAQPLRPLLPYVLDPELDTAVRPIGTPNLGMVDAVRLDDRRATVVVGDVDSGVPNRVDDVNCSINDLIADEQAWPAHGRFLMHVDGVVRELVADGLIDRREAAAIRRAAAESDV